MQPSTQRYHLANEPVFQYKVLMLTIALCQRLLNLQPKPGTDNEDLNRGILMLQAKAFEVLNQPVTSMEKLALSVAAILDHDDLDEGVDDSVIDDVLFDAFTGIAGVSGIRLEPRDSVLEPRDAS